ncbi:MAG TPA: AAA family ATPase [Dehalococcoidia bacterium]
MATLRLRREVAWRWHQRGLTPADASVLVPPETASPLQESLDLVRFQEHKQAFFSRDATAAYLTARIAETQPAPVPEAARGSFSWLVRSLPLGDVSAFALALGLLARYDAASAPVFGSCLNDANRTEPALSLVQRLWDRPEQCLALADAGHPLWRFGLLQSTGPERWEAPFYVPSLVADRLLRADWAPSIALERLGARAQDLPGEAGALVDRLRAEQTGLRLVEVRGQVGAAYAAAVGAVAQAVGRVVYRPVAGAGADDPSYLHSLLALAWLGGFDLLLQEEPVAASGERRRLLPLLCGRRGLPITVYVVGLDQQDVAALPPEMLLPRLMVPGLSYAERLVELRVGLGDRAAALDGAVAEAARRFRFQAETIRSVCAGLTAHEGRLRAEDLFAACRAAMPVDSGGLTRPVTPRFRPEELVLPPPQQRQLDEIERAMRALTRVHYDWGTARVWNESGVSVLFAGPSGTGKTMAAEVLAAKLDIPMHYVNLSQVVNKYIGETEKNLERVFDAADATETLLFFDEADALFGRRTEVKDAHDRYANLEVSYLLERMERFKGLAILATNRRGDVDEAFLRRLRYIVDFPFPDVAQRRAIWERVIPPGVDASELDFDLLARQFQLTGGGIRSVAFNACLQSAARDGDRKRGKPRLSMEEVITAVKREYDKLHQTVTLEQFGPHAQLIEELERV